MKLRGLLPLVLKELASIFDLPQTILFKKSLTDGDLLEEWKHADVVSNFKKSSKLEAGNYRPVSLTSISCEVLESIIRGILLKHLEGKNLLSHEQHGFRCNRSCLTNLLETFEEWTRTFYERFGIDAEFLDYHKVFDIFPYRKLISKLEAYGIDKKSY